MRDAKKIFLKVDENKDNIISFLKELIGIDSSTGNEQNAQYFLNQKFKEIGFTLKKDFPNYEKIEKNEYYNLRGNEQVLLRDNTRYNLIGRNPKADLLIFTHIDTHKHVWKNALAPRVIDNKIVGLGAADNKCGITMMYFAIKLLLESDIGPNVKIASTVGEENMGYEGILSCLLNGLKAKEAIYPHGQILKDSIVLGSSGWFLAELIEANEEKLVQMNKYLEDLSANLRKQYAKIHIPHMKMRRLPEKSLRTKESLQNWYYTSLLPFIDLSTIKNKTIEIFGKVNFEKNPLSNCFPNMINKNNKIVRILEKSFYELTIHNPNYRIQKAGSDMRWTNLFNIPTVSFGPEAGNFHKENEWVNIDDLIKHIKLLILAMLNYSGKSKIN